MEGVGGNDDRINDRRRESPHDIGKAW